MTEQQIIEKLYDHLRGMGVHPANEPYMFIEGDEILIDGRLPIKAIRVLADMLDEIDKPVT